MTKVKRPTDKCICRLNKYLKDPSSAPHQRTVVTSAEANVDLSDKTSANSQFCFDDDNEVEEEVETERFKLWKRNIPFLYDVMMINSLEWPSLTVQWLPETVHVNYRQFVQQKILLGTQAFAGNDNYLLIGNLITPIVDDSIGHHNSPHKSCKFEQSIRIKHEGEVNRARYMPQNLPMIATMSSNHNCYIFNCSKQSLDFKTASPELVLSGHDTDGFGLAWNQLNAGTLLTGAGGLICIWDCNGKPEADRTLTAVKKFDSFEKNVNDVKWHCFHVGYFGSVGDDKVFRLWDNRVSEAQNSVQKIQAHEEPVNSLSFSPFSEYVFLTASDDKTIGLFDMRNLKGCLHSFKRHTEQVLEVSWSPHFETIFASSGSDCRMYFWDMSKIGSSVHENDSIEAPAECVFVHGGHMATINDFDWNIADPCTITTVSNDNHHQIFKPNFDVSLASNSL